MDQVVKRQIMMINILIGKIIHTFSRLYESIHSRGFSKFFLDFSLPYLVSLVLRAPLTRMLTSITTTAISQMIL